jgi:microcystin degradation protein MlrC
MTTVYSTTAVDCTIQYHSTIMSFNVLTANFCHETNTFVDVMTTMANFEQHLLVRSHEEITLKYGTSRSAVGSTFECGRKYGWKVVPSVVAIANPSGRISDDVFDDIVDRILSAAQQAHKIDGAILHLHGSMVCVSHEDAEGEILRRLRQVIGDGVPVIVTLDLHGNISEAMVKHCNSLIAVRTYPHIDYYERGIQAGELLQRCMTGEVKLYTALCKVPVIGGCDGGRTQQGPMVEMLSRADAIEERGEALVVSICSGFTASDVYDIGPSVTVTVDISSVGDGEDTVVQRAQSIADSFGQYIWDTKEYCSLDILTIEEAVALAVTTENDDVVDPDSCVPCTGGHRAGGALVMADVSDNPGSGHHGDTTALLNALIAAKPTRPTAFFAICDPSAVRQGAAIGVDGEGTISLGGRHAPHLGGAPIEITGRVAYLGESPEWSEHNPNPLSGPMAEHVAPSGKCMRFVVNGNIDVCVISNNGQAFDIGQLTALGYVTAGTAYIIVLIKLFVCRCDPYQCRTIALKSKHHFRAHYESISRKVITVDGGGLGSVLLKGGGSDIYKHTRRPIWPIDNISYP